MPERRAGTQVGAEDAAWSFQPRCKRLKTNVSRAVVITMDTSIDTTGRSSITEPTRYEETHVNDAHDTLPIEPQKRKREYG